MIKNFNWLLTEEEKNRILDLHKRATQKNYLIIEADEDQKPSFLEINLNANWGDGMWRLTQIQKQSLKDDMFKIAEFVTRNTNNVVTVQIQAGESRVTNKDNESGGNEVEQGVIANNRAKELYRYLEEYLIGQLKLTNVEFLPTDIVIGKTPYEKGDKSAQYKKKYKEEYEKERFVKAIISIKGESDDCLNNMRVSIEYKKEWCNRGQDESKCHQCNESMFSVFLNGLPLNDKSGSNVANLNNSGDGGDRSWMGIVNSDIIKKIKSTKTNELVFTYQCAFNGGQGCHSDAIHIKIINGNDELMFEDFVSGGVRLKPSDGQRLLLKTDLCGNVIEVGKKLGPNSRPKRTVKDWGSIKDPIEKYLIVYKAIDPNTKLIDPKKIFDPVIDASTIRQWEKNPKTWEQFKKQYSITPDQEKQIIQKSTS